MTEEQIRQNAVKYSEQHCSGYVDGGLVDAYIEGAHSRDEEIKELELSLEAAADVVKTLTKQLNELRNPWISVEERLPEENQDDKGYSVEIIGLFSDGTVSKCFCSIDEGIWFIEGITCDKPTYWMPIPELKKEE